MNQILYIRVLIFCGINIMAATAHVQYVPDAQGLITIHVEAQRMDTRE